MDGGRLPAARMFRAAFTSRSCVSPHARHTHVLTPSPFTPAGPVRAPHDEQARLVYCSLTINTHLPACWPLYCSCALRHAPAGIEHGLGHPRPSQLLSAHVADDDPLITIYDCPTELMEGVGASARSGPVQALRLPPMPAPLGLRDRLLETAVEPTGLEPFTRARDGGIFQTEVDADFLMWCDGRLYVDRNRQTTTSRRRRPAQSSRPASGSPLRNAAVRRGG
jgi:hypothetical protein